MVSRFENTARMRGRIFRLGVKSCEEFRESLVNEHVKEQEVASIIDVAWCWEEDLICLSLDVRWA